MKKCEKIQLSNKEYDIYEIPLPLSVLWKHQKKNHLSYELGKIHPCFSEECCFDSKVSLTKKGLSAKVIVVNNYVLKNYEAQLKSGRLYSPEFKKKALFHKKNIKFRKILMTVFFLILSIITVSCLFFISPENVDNLEQNQTAAEKEVINIKRKEQAFDLLKNLLSCTKFHGGKFNHFEWKIDGYNEEFRGNIKNIYPENLNTFCKGLHFSALTFNDGLPGFSIDGKNQIELPMEKRGKTDFPKNEIRQLIIEHHGKMISENISPYEIKFEIPVSSNSDKAFLEYLNRLCNEEEVFLERIRFSRKNINLAEFEIAFSDYVPEDFKNPLSILTDNSESFFWYEKQKEKTVPEFKKEEENIERKTEDSVEITEEQPQSVPSSKILVGKVIHEDGTVTAFYKNKDGKIEINDQ